MDRTAVLRIFLALSAIIAGLTAFQLTLASTVVATALLYRERRIAPRSSNPYSRAWWSEVVPSYSDADFQRCFRVPRQIFRRLVDAARDHPAFRTNAPNSAELYDVELQEGNALWRQGRAVAVRDVAQHFGVSDSLVISATERTLRALKDLFMHEIVDRWPTSVDSCARLAAGMRARVREPNGFRNCIGALDGTLIPIWCPRGLKGSTSAGNSSTH